MSKPKVYITRRVSDQFITRLSKALEMCVWNSDEMVPDDVFQREIANIDGYIGGNPWTADLMDRAPSLRVIAKAAAGFDNIDIAAATERGIVVTNAAEVLTDTVADLAFGLLIAVARRMGEAERCVRAGLWTRSARFFGLDVHHAILGVIGLGRIGAAVAHRGLGFHMEVLYHDIFRREDLERQFGYRFVDLDTLLERSDFVTIHMLLTPQTRHMIGWEQLCRMKPTAYLINTSRGHIVDEGALIEALQSGRIAGAGLDVYEKEPIAPENPLLKMESVVLLPHVGSSTSTTREAMIDVAAENLIAVLQGKPPLTPVNPEVLSRLKK